MKLREFAKKSKVIAMTIHIVSFIQSLFYKYNQYIYN